MWFWNRFHLWPASFLLLRDDTNIGLLFEMTLIIPYYGHVDGGHNGHNSHSVLQNGTIISNFGPELNFFLAKRSGIGPDYLLKILIGRQQTQ